MPTQECLNRIQQEAPPYNRSCDDSYCAKVRAAMDQHCQTKGLPPDTPIFGFQEGLGFCYCCCSCYTLDTPIEVTPGEFMLIQNINAGDHILTADINLNWKPNLVKSRTGKLDRSIIAGLYLVRYLMPGEKDPREVIVTADHLFLMYTTKTLKKVQTLVPNNKIMTADGKAAEIVFVAAGEHNTAIQSINMSGKFDGKDLTGHLINANGIVSTDYAVQAYYETNKIDLGLKFKFSKENEVVTVGTKEYTKKYPNEHLDNFLAEPKHWPKGFYPRRDNIINIPIMANAFLTPQQSKNIKENSKFNPYASNSPREVMVKLFKMLNSLDSNVICILDWNNSNVNAYSWISGNQSFLVITGGLTRLENLFYQGLSIIMTDIYARLLPENNCVVLGDYAATIILRDLLPDGSFMSQVADGIKQIETVLFDKIDKANAGGNPDNICLDPSIACRKESIWGGLSLMPPTCGLPINEYFNMVRAYPSFDLNTITIEFDSAVDPVSGESIINYSVIPDVIINTAKINASNPNKVELSVTGLKKPGKYILSIYNLVSTLNQKLSGDTATIISI